MPNTRASLLGGAALGLALVDGAYAHHHLRAIDGLRLVLDAAHEPASDALGQARGLFAAGDVPGALAAFRRAAVAAPRSTEALLGVALCYDSFGRPDVARAFYEAALAINPASPELAAAFGRSLTAAGEAAANARGDDAATAHAWVPAAPVARIEQTSEGEQRLILGALPPAPELAAALGDDAPVVAVAQRWTERDEVALLDRENTALRSEAAVALASAQAVVRARTDIAAPVSPGPIVAAVPMLAAAVLPPGGLRWATRVPVPEPPPSAMFTVPRGPGFEAEARADRAMAQTIVANAATLRRNAPATGRTLALAGERPATRRTSVAFDSDDRALNAFAAKLRSRAMVVPPAGLARSPAAVARSAIERLDRFAARGAIL